MKTLVLSMLFIASTVGCKKSNHEAILPGRYDGTFERIQGNSNKEIANVSFEFTGNSFSGNSDKPRYPAICKGTYTVNGDKINFRNGCVWTADFDWTFVVDNQYELRLAGDSIEIKREYSSQAIDIYKLKKR